MPSNLDYDQLIGLFGFGTEILQKIPTNWLEQQPRRRNDTNTQCTIYMGDIPTDMEVYDIPCYFNRDDLKIVFHPYHCSYKLNGFIMLMTVIFQHANILEPQKAFNLMFSVTIKHIYQ